MKEKLPSFKWVWTPKKVIVAVVALAFLLRLWAAVQLPIDFDEPVYLEVGFNYAAALREGDLRAVVNYPENREHPPLVKLIYGMVIYSLGDEVSYIDALFATRIVSAVFGTLAVLLVALVNPLAGGMLAVHTLVVKYTSQAYLEALPHFTSLAAILAFWRFYKLRIGSAIGSRQISLGMESLPLSPWFWLSAVAFGLTMAGKYTYFPVIFVIIVLAFSLRRQDFSFWALVPYFAVVFFTFWVFNPSLWGNPIEGLSDSLIFHTQYAQSAHVEFSGYAWYQPLIWIAHSAGFQMHPEVIFYMGFDGLIFWLAVGGLRREWRARPWLFVWLLVSMLFLLVWPTKWPQYTLVLIPGLCLTAAVTADWLYKQAVEYESYYGTLKELLPRPPRSVWIMISGILLILVVGFLAHNVSVARSRVGWSQLTTSNSFLPSNVVHALLSGPEGKMLIGTDRGLIFWNPPISSDLPDSWTIYNSKNSGMIHDRVLSLAGDPEGILWIGTQSGVIRFDGSRWTVFRGEDMGLSGEQVNSLALGSDGRLWVGTSSGAAVFDGDSWQAFTSESSGLSNDAIFTLTIEMLPSGDRIWFGTLDSLSRLDTFQEEWVNYSRADFDLPRGGVAELQVDSEGRLWMASLGGGLYFWDGMNWQSFRTSNSEIPYNTVQTLAEGEAGVIWAGLSIPNSTGGLLASYNGVNWENYTPRNSGFSGAEPISMAFDSFGRLWIGTRTAGIDIYQFSR